jgi:hypothetical protein
VPKEIQEDFAGQIVDNSESGDEVIGVLRQVIPLNRNLGLKLFGQLGKLIRETI